MLRLLIVVTSTFVAFPTLAAGDEFSPAGPLVFWLFIVLLFSSFGYAIGLSLRFAHPMISLGALDICLLTSVLGLVGFQKFIERIDVVLTFLAIINLPLVFGFLVGRGKFRDLFAAFKKKAL